MHYHVCKEHNYWIGLQGEEIGASTTLEHIMEILKDSERVFVAENGGNIEWFKSTLDDENTKVKCVHIWMQDDAFRFYFSNGLLCYVEYWSPC
ncbi:hypothetical protein [Echinicola strongylocentroti]|uniref:hypothetical protein n=1 Tax=Echinicola strongylocentroti TaxID=1795355 RepID=UPI0013A6F304|nr:hypothetical protein [Echinicola strongylocentroti]